MGEQQIHVSRSALRAELAEMELRLVDRLTGALELKADQAVFDQVMARVAALELSRAERAHIPAEVENQGKRITALEKWRWGIPSLATLIAVAGLLLALSPHL